MAESRCFISFVGANSNSVCHDLAIPTRATYPTLPQFLVDHEEVSLLKGFYLCGKNFQLTLRSNVPTFFDPILKKQKTYKKILEFDPNKHYRDLNTGQWLDVVPDMYDRYLERIGNENLTLMQFCMHFHQGGNDDAEDIELNYVTPVSNVSIKLISFDGQNENEALPDSIELRSGKKMLLQKKPKLFHYPTVDISSEEFKEIQVLFYYPHKEITTVKLFMDQIFTSSSERFPGKTKVEVTRQLLHPLFSLDLYSTMCD